MKKIIATITMFVFFTCYPAYAFVPIVIPPLAIAAGAVIAASMHLAGIYYYMKNGIPGLVDPAGNLSRPSNVTYVDLVNGVPTLQTKSITAKMSYDSLQVIGTKLKPDGSAAYPSIKPLLEKLDIPEEQNTPYSVPYVFRDSKGGVYTTTGTAGSYFSSSTKPFVASTGNQTFTCPGATPTYCTATGSPNFHQYGVYNSTAGVYRIYAQPIRLATPSEIAAHPKIPTTGPEFNRSAVGNLDPASPLSEMPPLSAYQAELDKMFQDPDYVPVFTDDTTGLPYSPPSNALTPSQLASANATAVANEAKQQAAASSGSAAAAAGTAATTAAAAYQASGGDPATGIGGDPALLQKLRDAEAAAAAAQAADDKLKADLATDEAADLTESADLPPSDLASAGGLGSTIVDRVKRLGSNISSRAPFSYLTGVQDAISSLYASAEAPSFDLPLGPFASEPLHISMSWADPLAALTRFFSWLTFTLGAIWSFKGYWHRS